MMPPAIGIAGKPVVLTYIDPTYRVGLTVSLTVGSTTYASTPHPVLPGVYRVTLSLSEGTHVGTWTVGAEPQQVQNIIVYASSRYVHPARVSVVDQDGSPMQGVTVIVSSWDGVDHTLVGYDVTGPDGEAVFSLTNGSYTVSLTKSGCTFNRNNHRLDIAESPSDYVSQIDGTYIAVPDVTYTPPVNTVTMSANLIDLKGEPVPYRNIVVTCLTPAEHAESIQFLALEGRTVIRTTVTGAASLVLVPGIEVEVAVENTSVIRRFTVPDADFDLVDYLGANDYFAVAQVEYSTPERVS